MLKLQPFLCVFGVYLIQYYTVSLSKKEYILLLLLASLAVL